MRTDARRTLAARTLLLLALACASSLAAAGAITAYTGATLVDPDANLVTPDGVVVVEGDRIAAVGAAKDVAIPTAAKRVVLNGKWIVPGYIDVHTHLSGPGDASSNGNFFDKPLARGGRDKARARVASLLARHLRSGTTTVLDIGGPEWTLALRHKLPPNLPAPRIYAVGPIIGAPRPNFGAEDSTADYRAIATPEQGRAEVRRGAALGPDMLKLYMVPAEHTGKPFQDFMPAFAAALDEARKLGVRTTAHAMRFSIAEMGVDAGLDTLAHGILDEPASDGFIKKMRDRGLVMAPTLMVLVGPITTMSGEVAFTAEEEAWGEPEAIADLKQASSRVKGQALDQRRAVLRRGRLEVAQRNTKALHDGGVTLAVGTDAGFLGIIHGPSILHEMQLMAGAGLTPREVLAAASMGGARFLGREADLGSLAKGKFADMVVLEADPLIDIRNAGKIGMVIANGRAWLPGEILP